jgi:hypothetical protein
MANKTTDEVLAIVMAYGPDPRNKFLDDPKGDKTKDINPVLATMEDKDFDPFFLDFTQYVNAQDGLEDIDITDHALRNCKKWVSLANLVFFLQK